MIFSKILSRLSLSLVCLVFLVFGFAGAVFASGLVDTNKVYYKAEVIKIERVPNLTEAQDFRATQVVDLRFLNGEMKGKVAEDVDYPLPGIRGAEELLPIGAKVIVNATNFDPQLNTGFIIEDFVRDYKLWTLFGLFLVMVLAVSGLSGIKSFLGLMVSVGLIVFVFIPQVLAGGNPILLSLLVGLAMMTLTLFIAHGFNKKTLSALLGMGVTLVFVVILATLVNKWLLLTGFVDEEIRFLYLDGIKFDFVGLLTGSMLLGALGVLDDVTVSQSAIVHELNDANPKLSFWSLYERALRVGRDHIASTVNTLALAYFAASLPLFLLLYQGSVAPGVVLQMELIATEITRMIVGSMAIVLSIPLTNYIACYFVKNDFFPNLKKGDHKGCSC